MARLTLVLPVLFLVQASTIAAATAQESSAYRTVNIQPSDDILFNPGMGLYLAGGGGLRYQPDATTWPLQVADVIYFRPTWNDLEGDGPGEGFRAYFDPIFDFWVTKHGKRVAFRVMSASTHAKSAYATPKWVFDAGAASVEHQNLYGQTQTDPVFWDQRYLDAYCQFVVRLGKFLDGRKGLEYVDIGGIGEWGEMHLGLHMPGRWTQEQLESAGFTRDRYIAAYRRAIDAHAHAFPQTRVFLNVGDYGEINDYAALRGCHFRQDGLKPSGPSNNVGKRFYHPYSPRGVLCNYEFHSSYRSMQEKGWDLQEAIEAGLSDPISYLNTNVMSPRDWETADEDVKELFEQAARRIGYRFVLSQIRVPEQIHSRRGCRTRLLLEHRWKNAGIAPCHESYAIEFTLYDETDQALMRHIHYPQTPTSQWKPGASVVEQTLIRLPEHLKTSQMRLAVAVVDPSVDAKPIQLGIQGRSPDNRYAICQLPVVESDVQGGTVYEEGFEGEDLRWRPSAGIKLKRDASSAHDGEASLLLIGNQQGAWNYADHELETAVLPGSRYRLSCWMKIESLQPKDEVPSLKIGLHDSAGTWIANVHTETYQMSGAGQWQRLATIVETPLNVASGQLSVERGCKEAETSIRLWLDDIQLELLESP